ncbi:branched-chain amino acid transport system substrate-binding protein [Devosia sp. UYZn731]|uniref:transporter substrate-binding protein n=1 Tax=Devosia sp. UYZn731 TaxID=3156345 RepID=UPI003398B45A
MAQGNAIAVGVLFSASGPYAAIGREGLLGTLTAIDEINATQQYGLSLTAHVRDPHGAAETYAVMATELVAHSGARHILGCTTSWSRKEVIPVLEKTQATLWYSCPYEGFEANEQVVYLGACPNQHVLPLLAHILPRFGADGFLVGSNYIWGWETNRIARDAMETSGGMVTGERYIPLGDTDIAHIIEEIRIKRPSFVLNTLIGPSSHTFLAAYHALGQSDAAFAQDVRPVLSCNLAESELAELGEVANGQYAIAPYFQSLDLPENQTFLDVTRRFAPEVRHISAFFAQAYAAVHLLAAGIAAAGTDDGRAVIGSARGKLSKSPFGDIEIDAASNHAVLTPRIARARPHGFDIVADRGLAIRPDPYLARPVAIAPARAKAHLKVVK